MPTTWTDIPTGSSSTAGIDVVAAAPWVDVRNYTNLSTAVSSLGSNKRTLAITKPLSVSSDLTIPDNINLMFLADGDISPSSGVTVTINGHVQAPLRKIFGIDGSIVIGNNSVEAYPEWCGAVGDGATDDLIPLQKIIAAVGIGGAVKFANKTYGVSSSISPLSSQRWFGHTAGSMIQQLTTNIDCLILYDVSGVVFDHMQFFGASGTSNCAVLTSDTNTVSVIMRHCSLKSAGQHGLVLKGVGQSLFEYVESSGHAGDGLRVEAGIGGSRNNTNLCTFIQFHNTGIGGTAYNIGADATGGMTDCSFIRCDAEIVTGKGWHIKNQTSNCSFIQCKAEGTDDEAWKVDSTGSNILLNSCSAAASDLSGIHISSECTVINFNASDTTATVGGKQILIDSSVNQATLINPLTATEADLDDQNGSNVIIGHTRLTTNLGRSTTVQFGSGNTLMRDKAARTPGVSTGPVTIFQSLPDDGGTFLVTGKTSSDDRFLDIVTASSGGSPRVVYMWVGNTNPITSPDATDLSTAITLVNEIKAAFNNLNEGYVVSGSPALRDYSVSGSDLRLSVASGVYNVAVRAVLMPDPD